MSDDPAPRITAALESNPRLIAVVSDLPATWLDAEDVRIIRDRMARNHYDPNATEALRVLLCGIHELCIEIDRSHERNADQEVSLDGLSSGVADHRASLQRMAPRLAAADAFISAYKTTQAAQYKSNDYYAAASALEAAEVAYDALAGTGEGAS